MYRQVDGPAVQFKPWGHTRCVYRDQTHEVWHATISRGGFSSRHHHSRKDNLFYVVSGVLTVHCYRNEAETIPYATFKVTAGQRVVVEDGVWHQFVADLGPVELVEVYWSHLKGEDIVRADAGGLK